MGTCVYLMTCRAGKEGRLACSAAEIDSACATTRPGILVCLCQHKPRHAPTHPPHCCGRTFALFALAIRRKDHECSDIEPTKYRCSCYKERMQEKTTLPHGSPTRTQIRNQQQHDLHARPMWMHEWSYAEVQNPKPFVITVALILHFICTSGRGHSNTPPSTMHLSSDCGGAM